MLIDWFTVGAQALNFLILVWLLKHFLYKPVLNTIDTREKLIANELAEAAAKKAEAQKDRDDFQHKNEEFDRQRAGLLAKATDEAKAERQRLFEEARRAAEALTAKRQESLRADAQNLNQAISRLAQQEVFAIARRALRDLATTSLEQRMGEVFTGRLRAMDGQAKASLAGAIKGASEPVILRSAFELPADQRAVIQNALNETFSTEVHLRFQSDAKLVSGIELVANGQKVGWTIADYLTSLAKGVEKLLAEQDKPQSKPEAKIETKDESKPEVNGEPKAKIDSKPEAQPKPAPEAKIESKTEEAELVPVA
jgi:F-type H+-transporting ATPase subunit b